MVRAKVKKMLKSIPSLEGFLAQRNTLHNNLVCPVAWSRVFMTSSWITLCSNCKRCLIIIVWRQTIVQKIANSKLSLVLHWLPFFKALTGSSWFLTSLWRWHGHLAWLNDRQTLNVCLNFLVCYCLLFICPIKQFYI